MTEAKGTNRQQLTGSPALKRSPRGCTPALRPTLRAGLPRLILRIHARKKGVTLAEIFVRKRLRLLHVHRQHDRGWGWCWNLEGLRPVCTGTEDMASCTSGTDSGFNDDQRLLSNCERRDEGESDGVGDGCSTSRDFPLLLPARLLLIPQRADVLVEVGALREVGRTVPGRPS